MLIVWTGKAHHSPTILSNKRDYRLIEKAGSIAAKAVSEKNITLLAKAIDTSYRAQISEGMEKLTKIKNSIACKYLGGGHGGYALYLFKTVKARDLAAKTNKLIK